MFKNIKMYPESFLKTLSQNNLEILATNCFKTPEKNYELLAKIVPYLHANLRSLMFDAITLLEDKAVKIIIQSARQELLDRIFHNEDESPLSILWNQMDRHHRDLSRKVKRNKLVEIAEVLFEHQQLLDENDLKNYSSLANSDQFSLTVAKNFGKLQNMSMTVARIKENYMTPLYTDKKFASVEDILLSRSYSDIHNSSTIRDMYTNMLQGSALAANIAYNVARYILDGDEIKITLNKSTSKSTYEFLLDAVDITTPSDEFSYESILAHEFTHLLICKKFNTCIPFDISEAQNLVAPKNSLYGLIRKNEESQDRNSIQDGKSPKSMYQKYEKAAQVFLLKAASLLKADIVECKKYQSSSDLIKYLKDNTALDLFMDNANAKDNISSTDLSIKKAFYEAFYQHAQCNLDNKYLALYESDYNAVEKFVREKYFPLLVKNFNLTSNEIFFLERVADLANNAQDIYDCPDMVNEAGCGEDMHYIELLPRCVELSVMPNMNQDIIDSCKEIQDYWFENMYPMQEITFSGTICIANEQSL